MYKFQKLITRLAKSVIIVRLKDSNVNSITHLFNCTDISLFLPVDNLSIYRQYFNFVKKYYF